MRVLLVATKAPWPPVDGGRLLLRLTLEGLAGQGVRPVLVAPVDPRRYRLAEVAEELAPCCEPHLVAARAASWAATLLRTLRPARQHPSPVPGAPPPASLRPSSRQPGRAVERMPLSVARHAIPAVRRAVAALVAERSFDLVHCEQLQAVSSASPARAHGLPLVLRAQNVESDLWAEAGQGRWLEREAHRLAAWEGQAVAAADLTLALSGRDAERLRPLAAGAGRVEVLPAPFPERMAQEERRLPGAPPVVVLGSRGWRPNVDALAWFAGEVWPRVRGSLPGALLHVFGVAAPQAAGDGIVRHPAPEASAEAFPAGSIHVVPLRFGSGVRMKVLEAWARGVPVVATPAAVAGLEAEDGRELLVAEDAAGFASALARLAGEPALAASLVAGGRAALLRHHAPEQIARRLLAFYRELVEPPLAPPPGAGAGWP